MMNHCVPDFDDHAVDYHHFPSSPRSRKSSSMQQEDQVMELLWQNGQLVMQRPLRQAPEVAAQNGVGSSSLGIKEVSATQDAPQLFMQEDEMASWLHYPLEDEPHFDRDFCSDLLFPPPSASGTNTNITDPVQSSQPLPVPTIKRTDEGFTPQGFGHFSRFRPREEAVAGPKCFDSVVESNATPVKETVKGGFVNGGSSSVAGAVGMETTSLDFTVESSSGASGADPSLRMSASCDNKKRKGDEIESLSQDVVPKAADSKKQVHGSTAKRTRAAEVHNLSERRRRDRINEKMKALQELIPRCNKSDKASMLDDAIEYLKSLQMQVQMMSMGCGMVPMMFPGMQQYMQPMGMGMGMGMGVDVNRSMLPFPMATPTHMGPTFPLPSYHPIPPFVATDSSRIPVNNQGSMLNPAGTQNAYREQVLTIPDQYQQYLGSQTMQMQPPQNDVTTQPNIRKSAVPSGVEKLDGGPENLEPKSLPG